MLSGLATIIPMDHQEIRTKGDLLAVDRRAMEAVEATVVANPAQWLSMRVAGRRSI